MFKSIQELRSSINETCVGDDRIVVLKVLDKVQTALRSWSFVSTDFLDPYQCTTVKDILKDIREVKFKVFGGYKDAVRSSLILFHADLSEDMVDISDIYSVMSVTHLSQKIKLTHRDYLGAIMNLGVKRNFFGDLLVNKNGCMVIGKKSVIEMMHSSLTKVGKYNISTELKTLDDLIIPEQKYKEFTVNIPSYRLDCIVASVFSCPRSKAAKLIENGKVYVNYRQVTNRSVTVDEKSTVSCKGFGKIELLETIGTTRKDRFNVKVKQFI